MSKNDSKTRLTSGGKKKHVVGQFTTVMEYQADVLKKTKMELDFDWEDVPETVREMALQLREIAEKSFQYGWSLNDLCELSMAMPYGTKKG